MYINARVGFLAVLMIWALSHASVFGSGEPLPRGESSQAEKIRALLNQPLTLDYSGLSLPDLVRVLKEKTRVNWILDMAAVQQLGLGTEENSLARLAVTLKSDRSNKLRTAVQRALNAFNLTFVILDDSVLITTEEIGLARQMRQRVSVHLTNTYFSAALKDLARSTALNLVVDPRLGKEADAKISLHLDDATLETAVRLLAEMANLKSVRMGNVLFITNEARAEKMRREEPAR